MIHNGPNIEEKKDTDVDTWSCIITRKQKSTRIKKVDNVNKIKE